MKQFEAERLHALQQGHDGVLPGAAPRRGARLELEVRQQVVGEHHELLPRTVGGVGLGRDAVEGQPGLELRDGLLVVAPYDVRRTSSNSSGRFLLTRACKSDFLRLMVSGLSCVEEGVGLHHLSTTLEGLFQSQSAIARSEK